MPFVVSRFSASSVAELESLQAHIVTLNSCIQTLNGKDITVNAYPAFGDGVEVWPLHEEIKDLRVMGGAAAAAGAPEAASASNIKWIDYRVSEAQLVISHVSGIFRINTKKIEHRL